MTKLKIFQFVGLILVTCGCGIPMARNNDKWKSNLVETLIYKNIKKNAECANSSKVEVEKVGHDVNCNHTDSIINRNKKYSNSIHVYLNHTNSNQPIPADSTNIGSIHDSDDIRAIEQILASLVNYPVHTSPIFTYGSVSDLL